MNVDLPQAAQNKGRGRGPAGRGGAKAGLGQKMGEKIDFFFKFPKKNIFTQQDAFWLYCDKLFITIQSEHHSFYRKTQPTEECK